MNRTAWTHLALAIRERFSDLHRTPSWTSTVTGRGCRLSVDPGVFLPEDWVETTFQVDQDKAGRFTFLVIEAEASGPHAADVLVFGLVSHAAGDDVRPLDELARLHATLRIERTEPPRDEDHVEGLVARLRTVSAAAVEAACRRPS